MSTFIEQWKRDADAVGDTLNRRALSRLRQAIIDNTPGDMFWIRDILLSELEKETGFNGEAVERTVT